jgi:hypothetical protein
MGFVKFGTESSGYESIYRARGEMRVQSLEALKLLLVEAKITHINKNDKRRQKE